MSSVAPAIEINDLWFSYEVSESISTSVAKTVQRTTDGGCSIDLPRRQHPEGTQAAYKLQLKAASMNLPMGSRCILIGHNGAGKTTLMSVAGGKHMVRKEEAKVLGRPAFHDTSLANEVALLTGNWTHTVSFVGHNVPYQAMEVSRLIASHADGVDPARIARLVQLLEVDEKWNLTTVSDGQRRRVQILCKLLKPSSVLLLDEITTDLDLLARQDLLSFLREESEQRGVCIVYCTHIFDGLDGWPTHIAYISDGETKFCATVEESAPLMPVPPQQRARGWGDLFCAVQRLLLERASRFEAMLAPSSDAPVAPPAAAGAAVSVKNLTWGYPGSAPALKNLSLELKRGERYLLIGANGAGKTTLLKLLGGKHMLPRGAVSVLGHAAFHDTCLNTMISMLSGDWTRQVACVGNGVPFQADFSVGFMAKSFEEALVRDGADASLISARLQRLSELLDLNFEWRLHKVSDGQRRRAQLLLKLLRPSEVLLLDEVTTDLDVLSRQALLTFLREESEQRGTTVIYSTHIFDGLDDWPTQLIHMREGTVVYTGPPKLAPHATAASSSGSLFGTVRGWLEGEREERRVRALNAVPSCPSTDVLMQPAAPPPAKKPVGFASKFDRFGGASRQMSYF